MRQSVLHSSTSILCVPHSCMHAYTRVYLALVHQHMYQGTRYDPNEAHNSSTRTSVLLYVPWQTTRISYVACEDILRT